jgi:hypothetical protein
METIERLYYVVAINEKTGHKTYMTTVPFTHKQAMTIISKLSSHKGRRVQVEEAL